MISTGKLAMAMVIWLLCLASSLSPDSETSQLDRLLMFVITGMFEMGSLLGCCAWLFAGSADPGCVLQ